jgi:two-component system OmpR family response regulator
VSETGVVVPLSGTEYKLLRTFLAHPNRILNRDQLIDLMLSRDATPFDRSIDVQVSRLRNRLADCAKEPSIIKTVRGEGYVLSVPVRVER